MKETTISTKITIAAFDELTDDDRQLLTLARKATYRSYSPYSHFAVGAAIRLKGGIIVEGSNQENAAYPSGTCAERTAAYYAHAQYPDAKFECIAIAARDTSGDFVPQPISPCGACRQALLEYEKLAGCPVKVILAASDKVYIIESIHALLPLAFDSFD